MPVGGAAPSLDGVCSSWARAGVSSSGRIPVYRSRLGLLDRSYLVADATEKKPVEVDYRLWLQDGQMTVEEVASKSADCVAPVEVSVKTAIHGDK